MSGYTVEETGTKHTSDYCAYIKGPNGFVSPFHDIPLWADEERGIANMVVEIPRWTNAKFEVSKSHELNPICQDEKKGKVRFVDNCFPHHGYIWNYGCFPQTFEDPEFIDKHTNCKGDGDPIDVIEIGERVSYVGEVKQVKILGIMALVDEGETDWKVICIDVRDPAAAQLNDVDDIDKVMPGHLAATNEWFRIYKIPAGKPENTFAFNGEAKGREFALQIIRETAHQWQSLLAAPSSKIQRKMTVAESANKISFEAAAEIVSRAPPKTEPAPIDPSVQKWHYIRL